MCGADARSGPTETEPESGVAHCRARPRVDAAENRSSRNAGWTRVRRSRGDGRRRVGGRPLAPVAAWAKPTTKEKQKTSTLSS